MKKIFALIVLIVTLIIPQLGCQSQVNNQGIEKTSFHLDTICTITVYSMDGISDMTDEEQQKKVNSVITDAFKICDQYEKILSKTKEGSDIYAINHSGGKPVEVNPETIEVLLKGIEYGKLSEGSFDITIGCVSDLWDFHDQDDEGNKVGTLPDAEALAEAVKHVNYENIEINENTVTLVDPEAEIDLGGIAKGYIADRVAEYLEEQGVTSAVISLGGNIVTIGEKGKNLEDGKGTEFSIGIKDPLSESGELLGIVSCKDKTVVTSGTYERYFEVDGKKYHHVLDPKTGYPIDNDLLSITIISEKGRSVDCDGLSTTCLSLGKDKALALVQSLDGVEAICVDNKGEVFLSSDALDFKR